MTAMRSKIALVLKLCDAIVETVKESPEGAPSGILYLALMTKGITLEQYETLMGVLVDTGKLRKNGDLYFAV